MKLYQIAAFYVPLRPTKEGVKKNPPAKIIVEPKTILASSDETAQITAARMIPEEYVTKLEQVTIAVRPF